MRRLITQCPVCDADLEIAELNCRACSTILRGSFEPNRCRFCGLPAEQMKFLELFLRCRGNLRDVERTLGLSYPTVRARLDSLLSALGYTGTSSAEADGPLPAAERRREILEALNAGTLSADEAAAMLEAL
jgi:hypothetical protein